MFSGRQKTRYSSRIAVIAPAMGVHRPRHKNTPAPAAIVVCRTFPDCGRSNRAVLASEIRKLEIANRSMNSPLPGPAFAKVEYSRCNEFHPSTPTLGSEHRTGKPEIEPRISLFRV